MWSSRYLAPPWWFRRYICPILVIVCFLMWNPCVCLWGIVRSTLCVSVCMLLYISVWVCCCVPVVCISGLLLDLLLLCFTDSEPEPPEETPPACKTEHPLLHHPLTTLLPLTQQLWFMSNDQELLFISH